MQDPGIFHNNNYHAASQFCHLPTVKASFFHSIENGLTIYWPWNGCSAFQQPRAKTDSSFCGLQKKKDFLSLFLPLSSFTINLFTPFFVHYAENNLQKQQTIFINFCKMEMCFDLTNPWTRDTIFVYTN